MTIACDSKKDHLDPCFRKQEQPELAMIELTDASAYPETMVVKLTDASTALVAVATAVGLLDITNVTESFRMHFHRLNMA